MEEVQVVRQESTLGNSCPAVQQPPSALPLTTDRRRSSVTCEAEPGLGSKRKRSSNFVRRTSAFPADYGDPLSLQYLTFYNELRNLCSLKPAVECGWCFGGGAEVSELMEEQSPVEEGLPLQEPTAQLHHGQPRDQASVIEEMQFQLYLREIQRLNPSLKEGCLFVDGLYELVSRHASRNFGVGSPAQVQSSPRDLLTVHSSGTLLLQKYWHRPDDVSEYSAYLTVASSFVEYIHSIHGPQGVGQFLRQLKCSMLDPLEERFAFKGRDILSLEFKWKKFVEAQVNENFRLSTLGMVGVLLRRHLARYWFLLTIIFAIIIIDVALHLAFALASGHLVAFGHIPDQHNVSTIIQHGEAIVPLLQRVAGLIAAILLRFVAVMFSNVLQAYIAVNVSKNLRQKLSARLHCVTPKFLDDHSASTIISTFVQDVSTIENVISTGLRAVVWGAMMLVACVTYTLLTSWPLGLALTGVVLLGQLVVHGVSSSLSDHGFAKSQAISKLTNLLKEQIDGFHINKLYGLSDFWQVQINSIICQQYTKKARKSFILTKFILMFQMLIPNIIGGLLTFAIILLTQFDMLSFERGLSIFVFFTTTVISLTAASSLFPQLQAAAVSLGRINALLNCDTHTSTHNGYRQKVNPKTSKLEERDPRDSNTLSVEFRNVCFSYSSLASHWNLFDINLEVKEGEKVAIVGSSGSGKSTLLQLLMKTYEPTRGSVVIGDDSSEEDKDSLKVAATFQFNHIFSMSIRDNIRIGRLPASDREVEEAAKQADLHAWVTSLPRGYDTAVSSGGSSLSGGQRQRIAIARMLLSGAPVFVFDEVTSALDPATEKRVFANLMEVSTGKTVVAVTHRLEQAEEFDRIIVLSHGRIKEEGIHAQLIEERGTYWQMKTNQDQSQDTAVPIVRRRGSLSSDTPILKFTPNDTPAIGQQLLVTPAFIPLHTVAEVGESCVERSLENAAGNPVSFSSVKVVTANQSCYSRGDTSCLTMDSHPHPVGASTPDPHTDTFPSSARKAVVNLGSFSECTCAHYGSSSHIAAKLSCSQVGSVQEDITVLCLDGGREKSEYSLHKV